MNCSIANGPAPSALSPSALSPSGYEDGFARAHLPDPSLWPEFRFDLPELRYPERLNCAAALLDAALARGQGERVALVTDTVCWTYADLQRQVDRIAHVLREDLGLVTGARVLLRGANDPMMAAAILAVFKAGLIAVPTMPLLRAGELTVMLDKARIDAIVCALDLRGEVDALPAPPDKVLWFYAGTKEATDEGHASGSLEALMARHDRPFTPADSAADDVCLISFTSGTTGVPKATAHFHRDVLAVCDTFPRHVLAIGPDDICIGTPPLAFTFGLGGLLLFPLRAGACAVLLDRPGPEALLSAIARHRATVVFTAPTCYRQMAPLAARHDLSSLTRSVSAGEMLPVATRAAWQEATGLAMIDGIGSTEMLHIFISAAGNAIRPGATGKAIAGYTACVLGPDDRPVGPGVIGRLAVKGPTGCRYLADARQAGCVVDGWNLTGDAYEMDADGYFYYRGRVDDMIVSSGYNIAGAEVEEALLRHPGVRDVGVIGVPDDARGELVEAHVVLEDPGAAGAAMAQALQDFVKSQIAPYKYPRSVRFVACLPRTDSGKLQRFKLRQAASR